MGLRGYLIRCLELGGGGEVSWGTGAVVMVGRMTGMMMVRCPNRVELTCQFWLLMLLLLVLVLLLVLW